MLRPSTCDGLRYSQHLIATLAAYPLRGTSAIVNGMHHQARTSHHITAGEYHRIGGLERIGPLAGTGSHQPVRPRVDTGIAQPVWRVG